MYILPSMSVNIVNEIVCNICVDVDVVNVAYFSQLYIIYYVLSDCSKCSISTQLCTIAKRYLGKYTLMLTVITVNDSIQSRGPTRRITQDKVYSTWSVAIIPVVWSQPYCEGVNVLVVWTVVAHSVYRAAPSAWQFLGDNAETDTRDTVTITSGGM